MWCSQDGHPHINIHIHNILEDCELEQESVIKDYLITAVDGKNHQMLGIRENLVEAATCKDYLQVHP